MAQSNITELGTGKPVYQWKTSKIPQEASEAMIFTEENLIMMKLKDSRAFEILQSNNHLWGSADDNFLGFRRLVTNQPEFFNAPKFHFDFPVVGVYKIGAIYSVNTDEICYEFDIRKVYLTENTIHLDEMDVFYSTAIWTL